MIPTVPTHKYAFPCGCMIYLDRGRNLVVGSIVCSLGDACRRGSARTEEIEHIEGEEKVVVDGAGRAYLVIAELAGPGVEERRVSYLRVVDDSSTIAERPLEDFQPFDPYDTLEGIDDETYNLLPPEKPRPLTVAEIRAMHEAQDNARGE